MVITGVAFERLIPQGGYANIRIRLEASVSPDENAGDAVRALDKQISDILTGTDIRSPEAPPS